MYQKLIKISWFLKTFYRRLLSVGGNRGKSKGKKIIEGIYFILTVIIN